MFTTKDLVGTFHGLKANTLHYWCVLGYIEPIENPGRGGKRLFDEDAALKVGVMFSLTNLGFGRKISSAMMKGICLQDAIFRFGKNGVEVVVNLMAIRRQLTSALS